MTRMSEEPTEREQVIRELRIAAGHRGERPTEDQLEHYADRIIESRT